MPLGMNAEECNVAALFASGEALRMPPYQRSYSWTEKEALDLLGDLVQSSDDGSEHFVGAIVLVRPDPGGPFEIVDGQQRLTTLTILLSVLRDLADTEEVQREIHSLIADPDRPLLDEAARWRLTLNHIDGPFFRETVQTPASTLKLDNEPGESDSQRRMSGNAAALKKALAQYTPERRNALFETVRDRCLLVRCIVTDRDQGYKVFRVLNTRGKEPNAHDIIKTELFERAKLDVEQADHYARAWLEYEARLGGGGFDDLHRQIRFMYDRSPKGELVNGFRKAVLSRVDALTFLDELLPAYVDAYEEITTGRADLGDYSDAVMPKLNQLRALEHQIWRAPALKLLVERRNAPEVAPEFFTGLERLGYIIQLVVQDRDQRNKRYRRVIEAIPSDKSLFGRTSPLAISRDEARKVGDRLLGRFGTFGQRRSMALRLNAALQNGKALAPDDDATVEHVLPRNVDPESFWVTLWPDAQKRRDYCDSLGNFILLPRAANQKADRMDYRQKKAVYFETDPVFALTEDLADIDTWTPDIVRQRTQRLATILLQEWDLTG